MQEIVSDGVTGLHFAAGQPDDLAAKTDWAWTHPEETNAMGREARRQFESKYSAEVNYKLLMDIYDQVISRTRALGC